MRRGFLPYYFCRIISIIIFSLIKQNIYVPQECNVARHLYADLPEIQCELKFQPETFNKLFLRKINIWL